MLTLLGLAIIVLSGVRIVMLLDYMKAQALESGERLTAAFAQVIAEETSRTFQSIDQRAQLIESRLDRLGANGELTEAAANRLLVEEIKNQPFIRAVSVLDASGRVRYSSVAGSTGVSLADRAYFQTYRTTPGTDFNVGAPIRSRTTGDWLISATRPLRSESGAFKGLIVAAADPKYFDKLWQTADLGDGGSIALFRRDGTLMLRSPFDEASMGKNYLHLPIFTHLQNSPSGTFQNVNTFDDVERIFAHQSLPVQQGLVVVVGKSRALVLAQWREFAFLSLTTWAAASLAIAVLGLLLNRAWLQRLKSEARIEQMATRLTLATDAASIGVWEWERETYEWRATPTYFTMLGYEAEDSPLRRDEWVERIHPDDRDAVLARVDEALGTDQRPYQYTARFRHRDGDYRWLNIIGRVLARDPNGQASRLLGVRIDVTETKRTEEALRSSLREQEALLKEVHHRVKNNLQVISSLLRLETGRSAETNTRVVLKDMQGRIHAMALLHESLYKSGNFAEINLADYLRRLATQLFRVQNSDPAGIGLRLDLSPAQVEIDQAIPCGLIVNELLTNSLKHAFPDGRGGEVTVCLRRLGDDRLQLEISDTGVGLPKDFEEKRRHSLGLQLAADLSKQLGGQFDIGPGPAAAFFLTIGPPHKKA